MIMFRLEHDEYEALYRAVGERVVDLGNVSPADRELAKGCLSCLKSFKTCTAGGDLIPIVLNDESWMKYGPTLLLAAVNAAIRGE